MLFFKCIAVASVSAFVAVSGLPSASAHDDHHHRAKPPCRTLRGDFTSVPATVCTSPVGMCTIGELEGSLRGSYEMTMGTLTPAPDPTIPSVFFYTSTSVITVRRGHMVGTDSGAINLNPFGNGAFTSLITITDGDSEFEAATGYLQIRGKLDFNTGKVVGDYRGEVCTP